MAALLAALALIATACGSGSPTATPTLRPSPTSTPAATTAPTATASATPANPSAAASADQATYARIETQVEQLRQLTAKQPVTPILLDEQGVHDWMVKSAQSGVDHVALAAQSRLFVHLGLLPAGASLEQLELDLEAGQAIGFYDPASKGLYLLSSGGTVGPEQQLTFSHEFTHALQDQNFGLDKLATDTADQSDRDLARTALPEGDATLAMTQWAEANMSLGDLLTVTASSGSAAQTQQLNNAPAILREQLTFPYLQGLAFVQGIYNNGGWAAVDKLYSRPPSSTSQIIHPELYAAGIGPVAIPPAPVPAAAGKGWKLTMADTMGELQLRVWLAGEHPTATAETAAETAVSTWAGDRIGLYEGPSGAWAVVLKTQWRSGSGLTKFLAAVQAKLNASPASSLVCSDAAHADIILASDPTVLGEFATCKQAE
jgi:hypothetical protein